MKTSLYIHIPFCQKKCFYCSFVVAVGHDNRIEPYLNSLSKEAQQYAGTFVQTIYLGGGTPTYLNTEQLSELFEILKENFKWSPECEITVEGNPEGLSPEKLELLKKEGVTRFSLGIQTLNDRYLKYLGRCHTAATAVQTFKSLRACGFQNINCDLMYSFPGQTDQEIKEDVTAITALNSEHLSLYTLTIEEPSRFHVIKVQLDDSEKRAAQYELVLKLLAHTGFNQYEVSNFAQHRRESEHNLNYWEGGNYIGLGVGAHSHINGVRSWNVQRVDDYIIKLNNGLSPVEAREELSLQKRLMETIVFGLRMNKGVDIIQVTEQFGLSLPTEAQGEIGRLIEGKFLAKEEKYLKVTPQGRLILDEIAARLV